MVTFNRLAVHRAIDDSERIFVILQYPGLDTGPSVLAAPLFRQGELPPLPPVTVDVVLQDVDYLVAIQQASAFPTALVGPEIGDLQAYDYDFQRALSRLFFGN
ncbi:MAG: hypothetical protein Hens3KO_14860 [Henriciella sp.]